MEKIFIFDRVTLNSMTMMITSVITLSMLSLSMYAEAWLCRTEVATESVCPDSIIGSPLATYIGTKSEIACSSLCSRNDDCRSFQYDPNDLRCWTNAERISSFSSNCSDQVTYGYIERATCEPHWMFELCSNADDCQKANSTCVGGICECKNGHPYHFRSDTCQTGCTNYGDAFHEVSYYLASHNYFKTGGFTLAQCFDRCVSETSFVCRFIEYNNSSSRCFLSKYTALTLSDFYYENYTGWRQFDRNCA